MMGSGVAQQRPAGVRQAPRTDLGAELDRSRRGSGPISTTASGGAAERLRAGADRCERARTGAAPGRPPGAHRNVNVPSQRQRTFLPSF